MVDLVGSVDLLKGKVLANVFYEPSTRTASSFIAAMERLGGSVIAISEVRYSSVAKGETLEDTVRTLESYADVIVLRHHEEGAAERASSVMRKPLVNAGEALFNLAKFDEAEAVEDQITAYHSDVLSEPLFDAPPGEPAGMPDGDRDLPV